VKKPRTRPQINLINAARSVPKADLLDDARLTNAIALDRAIEGLVADEVSAEAALEAGDVERAIAIYTRLIDSSSSPIASFLIGRGRALYRAGSHEAAITDFERGLALEPHYPDLYFDKGKAELQVGWLADAETSFTEDIELDPSPISHYNRHLARKALGNHDGALADLDAAIAELPDEPALRVARAVMRHAADDHAGAFEDADAAATLDPADLMHLDLCGRFALLAGDDARAAAVYATAIALAEDAGDPPNPKHFEGHALALAGLNRFAEALPHLDRAVALMPGEPTFLCNRGWTLHQLGRSAEALVDLDRALSLDGTYAQALRNRAAIFASLGDRNRALADYRTLDSLGHDVTDAIARLVAP
jgi:tetratricopeptide (TPR) repeat protein